MTTEWPEFDDVIDPEAVPVPGSRPRVEHQSREKEPRRTEDDPWDAHPKVYRVDGREQELFGTAALGKALGRKAETMKHWEIKGWLPKTSLRLPRKTRSRADISPITGQPIPGRRLYTRAFIEGLVEIANKYGLIETPGKSPEETGFPEDALALYYRTMPGEPAQ
jgi:hypothetical protein